MPSSPESIADEAEGKLLGRRSLKAKKVGRPFGVPHQPYTIREIEVAFQCLIDECPPNPAGNKFLLKLQTKMKAETKLERTTSALQTFVKGKLRDWVPEMFQRTFKKKRQLSKRESLFLSEFMKSTDWKIPKIPRQNAETNAEDQSKGKPQALAGTEMKESGSNEENASGPSCARQTATVAPVETTSANAEDLSTGKPQAPAGLETKQRRRNEENASGPSCVRQTVNVAPVDTNFTPPVASTPKPVKADSGRSSLKTVVRGYVSECFEEFKQEAMAEVRRMVDANRFVTKRRRLNFVPKLENFSSDDEVETGGASEIIDIADSGSSDSDSDVNPKKTIVVRSSSVVQVTAEEDCEHVRPEADGVQERPEGDGVQERPEDDGEQVRPEEIGVEVRQEGKEDAEAERGAGSKDGGDSVPTTCTLEAGLAGIFADISCDQEQESTSIRGLLEGSITDEQLLIAASDSDLRERAASFRATPLRASIATLTLVKVFNVNEEKRDTEGPTFRVLEEPNGDLTIAHMSSLDLGDWSNMGVVNQHNSTLEEELESVLKGDIVEHLKEGPPLSPMTVQISSHKRAFKTATIKSKGRDIKVLLKRNEQRESIEHVD